MSAVVVGSQWRPAHRYSVRRTAWQPHWRCGLITVPASALVIVKACGVHTQATEAEVCVEVALLTVLSSVQSKYLTWKVLL